MSTPRINLAKLDRLRMDLTVGHAALNAMGKRYRDEMDDARGWEHEVTVQEQSRPFDPATIERASRAAVAARAHAADIKARMDVESAKVAPLAALVAACDRYVKDHA